MLGSSFDLALGIILIACVSGSKFSRSILVACTSCAALLFSAGFFTVFDTKRMASGVFRTGIAGLQNDVRTLAHYDGSTASISVIEWVNIGISIITNGKPEAAISYGKTTSPTLDEYTMTLLAAIPLSIHPSAKTVANIGFGSGLTTHTLLLSDEIEKVDSIEIEPAIIKGAKYFIEKNENAFFDPRSHINIDDAKTYFHSVSDQYDIIISEPSNPWVSGISSLFTEEFYQTIKKSLNDEGIFAQWLHTYESDIKIVLPILKTISENFEDYQIYATNHGDILIISSANGQLNLPSQLLFKNDKMKTHLATIGVHNMHDLSIRFLGNKRLLDPFVNLNQLNTISDYFPHIDFLAVKSRFMFKPFTDLHEMRSYMVPIVQFFEPVIDAQQKDNATLSEAIKSSTHTRKSQEIYQFIINNLVIDPEAPYIDDISLLLNQVKNCDDVINEKAWVTSLFNLHIATVAYLHSGHLKEIAESISLECTKNISDFAQNLMNLYIAYAERNSANIALFSNLILNSGHSLSPSQKEYIFSSLILSLISLRDYEQALENWNHTIDDIYPEGNQTPFPLRVLHAILVRNT